MSSILSVRLSDEERSLLEEASLVDKAKISDFVRRKAIEAAEMRLLKRSSVSIPAKDWEKFEDWVHSPAAKIPALTKLSKHKPTWQ